MFDLNTKIYHNNQTKFKEMSVLLHYFSVCLCVFVSVCVSVRVLILLGFNIVPNRIWVREEIGGIIFVCSPKTITYTMLTLPIVIIIVVIVIIVIVVSVIIIIDIKIILLNNCEMGKMCKYFQNTKRIFLADSNLYNWIICSSRLLAPTCRVSC